VIDHTIGQIMAELVVLQNVSATR